MIQLNEYFVDLLKVRAAPLLGVSPDNIFVKYELLSFDGVSFVDFAKSGILNFPLSPLYSGVGEYSFISTYCSLQDELPCLLTTRVDNVSSIFNQPEGLFFDIVDQVFGSICYLPVLQFVRR